MDFYVTVPRRTFRRWMGNGFNMMVVAASWWNNKSGKWWSVPSYYERSKYMSVVSDCGGYLFAKQERDFPFNLSQYVEWGTMWGSDWLATMDYPCEDVSHQEVIRRINKTVENAKEAISCWPQVDWRPVLQGFSIQDYEYCYGLYDDAGIVPRAIGTLCSRSTSKDIASVLGEISLWYPGRKYHLFGVKLHSLRYPVVRCVCESFDSSAWDIRPGGCGKDRFVSTGDRALWSEVLPTYISRVKKACGGQNVMF